MDEGRIRDSGECWSADEIWKLGNASELDWCCIGCKADLTPVAWRPEMDYKRAAHFAARGRHEVDCGVVGLEKLMYSAKRKTIKTVDGLPAPYPSIVRFVDRCERVAHEGESAEGTRTAYVRPKEEDGTCPQNPNHRRTVTTIRQVCRFYLAFPQLREASLDVPGCDGKNYYEIFKPLSNSYTGVVEGKILYAGIRFKESPEDSPEQFRIALNLKNKVSTDGEIIFQPVYFSVDWSEWSTTQRGLFRNSFTEVREELGKRYREAKQGSDWPSATIFFIGSSINGNEFRADDHRKICLLDS